MRKCSCNYTGCYAETHGVTANVEIYDNKNIKLITRESPEYFKRKADITPIWTLNELAGQHSAVSMWNPCQFEFHGILPTYMEEFNSATILNWKQRIDNIIPLMTRNESQIDFVAFYINDPDGKDHTYSPNSEPVSRKQMF